MPAFDPVRDAVLNSPVEQHTTSLASPLASPSLGRRATDLSVLLNSEPASSSSARPSSLSRLVTPHFEDKLTTSEPLARRQAAAEPSRSSQASYPVPIRPQATRRRESPSPTRYERQHQHQDSRYPNSRPSSSSSTSTTHTIPTRSGGASGSASNVLNRQTSSPSMPPPAIPSFPSHAGPVSNPSDTPPSTTPTPPQRRVPYMPTKRLTPAVSVLKPLTPEEVESYRKLQGQGAARLTRKRKRSGSASSEAPPLKKFMGDVGFIADHYNSRPDVGVVQRQDSPIIGLKNFNNWVKSVLITRFAHPVLQRSSIVGYGGGGRKGGGRGKVLDMGCGKGGDIMKWSKARIKEILCVDIADVSVEQARHRYQGMRHSFDASFAALDCYTEPLSVAFSPQELSAPFDVVSMQFCMHYAFETEEKVRCMLDNVSRYMRPGGVFIGTIPNADLLMSQLQLIPEDSTLEFGNSVYKIKFEQREHDSYFGHKYWFFLQDAVDDVPEYVVHWDNFVSMAAEFGLYPIYKEEFHTVFSQFSEVPEFKDLMVRMKVVDSKGESAIDEDQWEATNIYNAFAFEKR